ncbi:hypothetical protein C7H84_29390 [Burkholderia sp. Nafp2/4-1b]|nr:hypothetical protein C7H84_29390 [Burkholderia sp. Nafp2/4-1b]
MACANRLPDTLRAPTLRRLPDARAMRRRADPYRARRRATGNRGASRGAVACRRAWPGSVAGDASASEEQS